MNFKQIALILTFILIMANAYAEKAKEAASNIGPANVTETKKLPVSRTLAKERLNDPSKQLFPASAIFNMKGTQGAKAIGTSAANKDMQKLTKIDKKLKKGAKKKKQTVHLTNKPEINKTKNIGSAKQGKKQSKTSTILMKKSAEKKKPALSKQQMKEILMKKGLIGPPM